MNFLIMLFKLPVRDQILVCGAWDSDDGAASDRVGSTPIRFRWDMEQHGLFYPLLG